MVVHFSAEELQDFEKIRFQNRDFVEFHGTNLGHESLRLFTMQNEFAPKEFQGLEYFETPNPFIEEESFFHKTYLWDLPMALKAFEMGYCDGFFFSRDMQIPHVITVVGSGASELRKYTEREWGDCIRKVNEASFQYGIWMRAAGFPGWLSYRTTLEDATLTAKFQADKVRGQEGFAGFSDEELLQYFIDSELYTTSTEELAYHRVVNPVTFSTFEAAKHFAENKIGHAYDNDVRFWNGTLWGIRPINISFENWFREWVKTHAA